MVSHIVSLITPDLLPQSHETRLEVDRDFVGLSVVSPLVLPHQKLHEHLVEKGLINFSEVEYCAQPNDEVGLGWVGLGFITEGYVK